MTLKITSDAQWRCSAWTLSIAPGKISPYNKQLKGIIDITVNNDAELNIFLLKVSQHAYISVL